MQSRYLPILAVGAAAVTSCGGAGNDPAGDPAGNPNDPTPPATATMPYLDYDRPLVFTVGQSRILGPDEVSSRTTITISPELPAGLALDAATGKISGTPATLSPGQFYTLTASNAQGAATTQLVLEVDDGPLFYASPALLQVGAAMVPMVPSGTAYLSEFTVSPALPDGLSLDAATGVIAGTPTEASSPRYYLITGADTGFKREFGLTLGVTDPAAPPAPASLAPYLCVHSGGFLGTFAPDSMDGSYGLLAIAFTPDGHAHARVADLIAGVTADSDGREGLSAQMDDSFLIEFPGPTLRQLRGRFMGPDVISGTYQFGSVAKAFMASRLGGSAAATYRYSGGFGSDTGYRIDFGTVDVTGAALTGAGYQMGDAGADYVRVNRQLSFGATIRDGLFTVTADNSTTQWTYVPGEARLVLGDPYDGLFYIVTQGCQLN